MAPNLAKIQHLFSDVLNVKPEAISMESTMDNLDEWDSMKHLDLVMSIETAFGVSFEVNEIVELNTVEKIINILSVKKLI